MVTTKLAVEITGGNPAERILVIAPNHREFTWWCHANEINPRARNVVCVISDRHLRGYANCWYVNLGVPPGHSGTVLHEMFRYMKLTCGLKNAEVISEA